MYGWKEADARKKCRGLRAQNCPSVELRVVRMTNNLVGHCLLCVGPQATLLHHTTRLWVGRGVGGGGLVWEGSCPRYLLARTWWALILAWWPVGTFLCGMLTSRGLLVFLAPTPNPAVDYCSRTAPHCATDLLSPCRGQGANRFHSLQVWSLSL